MGRDPHDGRPFYCVTCGHGFAEFVACEEPDCTLETTAAAEARATAARAPSARDIVVDPRPLGCPAARAEAAAGAIAAMARQASEEGGL